MKKNRTEILCWVLAALPLAATLCCLPTLPARIPMHWNIAGEIDSWGGRGSAFFVPLLALGLNLMFAVLPKIDPRRANYVRFAGAYMVFRLVYNLFMLGMTIITLVSAYRPGNLAVGQLVSAGIGALFCVLGNYMPRFKPNYFIGIRTPWTLASEQVWYQTHRLGGVLWFWGGLAVFAASFLLPSSALFAAMMAVIVVIGLVPTAASYFYYRALPADGGDEP